MSTTEVCAIINVYISAYRHRDHFSTHESERINFRPAWNWAMTRSCSEGTTKRGQKRKKPSNKTKHPNYEAVKEALCVCYTNTGWSAGGRRTEAISELLQRFSRLFEEDNPSCAARRHVTAWFPEERKRRRWQIVGAPGRFHLQNSKTWRQEKCLQGSAFLMDDLSSLCSPNWGRNHQKMVKSVCLFRRSFYFQGYKLLI